jgi:hypothetical protein
MRLLWMSFLLGPLMAQPPAPDKESALTGSLELGYRWGTGVGGSFDSYRSVVNLGAGPTLLGAELTLLAEQAFLRPCRSTRIQLGR